MKSIADSDNSVESLGECPDDSVESLGAWDDSFKPLNELEDASQSVKNVNRDTPIIISASDDSYVHAPLNRETEHSHAVKRVCLDVTETAVSPETAEVTVSRSGCQKRSREEISSDVSPGTETDDNLPLAKRLEFEAADPSIELQPVNAKRLESEATDSSRDLQAVKGEVEAGSRSNSEGEIEDQAHERQNQSLQVVTSSEEQVSTLQQQVLELRAKNENMTIRHKKEIEVLKAAAKEREEVLARSLAASDTKDAARQEAGNDIAKLMASYHNQVKSLKLALAERECQLASSRHFNSVCELQWQYGEAIAALNSNVLERDSIIREEWDARLNKGLRCRGIDIHELDSLQRKLNKVHL